jgi:hypothetical protein
MHRPTSRPRLRIRAGGNRKGALIDTNLREADRRSDRMRGAPSVGCSRGNVNRRTHTPASLPLSAPWPDFRSSEHGVGAKPSHERRGTSVARGRCRTAVAAACPGRPAVRYANGGFLRECGVKTKHHSLCIPSRSTSRFIYDANRLGPARFPNCASGAGTKPVQPVVARPSICRHCRREPATRRNRRQPRSRRPQIAPV